MTHTIRQLGGDDGYHWCVLRDGRVISNGLMKTQAEWERDRLNGVNSESIFTVPEGWKHEGLSVYAVYVGGRPNTWDGRFTARVIGKRGEWYVIATGELKKSWKARKGPYKTVKEAAANHKEAYA